MTGDVNWISINTFCVECISSEFRDVDSVRRIIPFFLFFPSSSFPIRSYEFYFYFKIRSILDLCADPKLSFDILFDKIEIYNFE